MRERAITGIFFVLVLIASLLLGKWSFSLFFMLISLLSLNEFYKIIHTETIKPNKVAGILLGGSLFLCFILFRFNFIEAKHILLSVPFITLLFVWELFRKSVQPFSNIAFTFFGVLFAVLPFIFFVDLGFLDGQYNFHYPLGFLILLWSSDTGAYLAGRSLGKSKLFERHSPKKTWEGFFGGLLLSIIASVILTPFFTGIALWQWVISAAIIASFGTYGDLSESMLKRSYNIKDSGNILPGHGGLLDRFDGLLLSAPLVYIFILLTL